MANSLRVLLVEDSASDVLLILRELRRAGFEPVYKAVATEEDYLAQLPLGWDLVISDYYLPLFSQERALKILLDHGFNIPFIVVSNAVGEERAVVAIKNGAYDWIQKTSLERLGPAVRGALDERSLWEQTKQADLRQKAFSMLGQKLSLATTPRGAAEIIFEIATELFDWDACTFDVYSSSENVVERILLFDTIDGKKLEVPGYLSRREPTRRECQAITNGGLLILRQPPFSFSADVMPFGDKERPSASILFVPLRSSGKPVGFCSLQSYRTNAYNAADLSLFQTLADFCGGALERIRAQETLRKNEERYRSLVLATSQMVWTAAADGQVVEDSPTWRGYTGQSWNEFKSWGWLLALHPDDIDATLEIWTNALRTKTFFQTEFRVRSGDGSYRDFSVRGAPVIEPGGAVREWVATCTDTTDSKRAERRNQTFFQLARQLNSARTAQDAARHIVDVADRLFGWDACYLYLYSRTENSLDRLLAVDTFDGQKRDALHVIGKKPSPTMLRVLEHGAELILRNDKSVASDLTPFGSKTRSESIVIVPIRNGAEVIGLLSIQSYTPNAYDYDDLNTVQALADFCGGVLERLRAEESLFQSEERFRTLIEHAADAIFVYDPDGKIVDANQRACLNLGYSHQELLNLNVDNIDMQFTEDLRRNIANATASGEPFSLDSQHRRKDGSVFPVELRMGLLEFKKQRLCLALARDVTERRQLEEQFRQSQKMEAFGQLAGGVAHDFNNLLTVISGYTNLVLSSDTIDLETREQLQEIFSASEKATNLTRQLLTLSRKKEIQLEPLHLSEVVANMGKILKRIIGEDIRLECHYSPNLPIVEGDVGMLEQVLLNLAVNARDAMPKGGRLFISSTSAQLARNHLPKNSEAYAGNFVCLSVRDSGCGIPPEIKSRIFEPFFTTKGGKGTGLGLATVYSIVKQHKGWLDVHSEPEAGTTFKIFFPATAEKMNGHAVFRAEPAVVGGSETILLVEDEPALRALARQILLRQGYRVLEAESGKKALDVWKDFGSEIDLLLTDMVMPDGVTGRDLAKKLEAERSDLKVIYTTGYSVILENPDCELREGWNFLQKPYHPRKLANAVRARLDEEKVAVH